MAPPPAWKAAILARVDEAEAPARGDELSARRARRRWWLAAAPSVAVAATIVLLFTLRKPGTSAEPIAYATTAGDGTVRGSGAPALHDRLQVTAHLADAGALRVYRDDRVLVAQCPGDAACTQRPTGKLTTHAVTLTLDAPGRYHVVLLLGAPPPATGRYDDDFAAARAAGASIIEPRDPTFTVR